MDSAGATTADFNPSDDDASRRIWCQAALGLPRRRHILLLKGLLVRRLTTAPWGLPVTWAPWGLPLAWAPWGLPLAWALALLSGVALVAGRADARPRSSLFKNRHRQHSRPGRRGRRNGRADSQCPRQPHLAGRDDPNRARRRRGALRDLFPRAGPVLRCRPRSRATSRRSSRGRDRRFRCGSSMSPIARRSTVIQIRMPKAGRSRVVWWTTWVTRWPDSP